MARRTGFYLDKHNGKLMGVCSGIADYTGFDVLWIRLAFVLGAIFGSGVPVIIYFAIAWMADDKPASLYQGDVDPADKEFWQKTRLSPGRSVRDVRSSFRDIDRRLRDAELTYTSQQSKLSREIDELH